VSFLKRTVPSVISCKNKSKEVMPIHYRSAGGDPWKHRGDVS
jgi:hypothetical protein